MSSEASAVELDVADTLFAALPPSMQWPTLSPAYVSADATRDSSLRPVFLVSQQGDGILMHMVHESPVDGTACVDWQSPYGYGGPLAAGLDAAALERAWRALDALATARRVVAEFVRFHPLLHNDRSYPGMIRDDRHVVAIDLGVPDLMASYEGRARTAIRKAERNGLAAVWETRDEALAHFPEFHRRCMVDIGAADFYRFPDVYFERLFSLPGARVLSIQQGDARVSMGVFLQGPVQAEYHLSGTIRAARDSGATNLLLHTAARSAKEAGCRTLYLGGGTGSRADDPLLRFKRSFCDASAMFRIGHRIHDPATYDLLKGRSPEKAATGRILFYRS